MLKNLNPQKYELIQNNHILILIIYKHLGKMTYSSAGELRQNNYLLFTNGSLI